MAGGVALPRRSGPEVWPRRTGSRATRPRASSRKHAATRPAAGASAIPVRKQEAMREAHSQAAAVLRQYAEQQGDGLADNDADDEKVRAAMLLLADRHDRAAIVTRPYAPGGDV